MKVKREKSSELVRQCERERWAAGWELVLFTFCSILSTSLNSYFSEVYSKCSGLTQETHGRNLQILISSGYGIPLAIVGARTRLKTAAKPDLSLSTVSSLYWQFVTCIGKLSILVAVETQEQDDDQRSSYNYRCGLHLIWKKICILHLSIFFLPTFNNCDPTCATSPICAC